mmetsp:Transcript_10202/g.12600  ORF Transcript_10202/g.12600 Transcript_10202/m.12600 type:complete len:103 (+) Transcript_10202:597-905(+)
MAVGLHCDDDYKANLLLILDLIFLNFVVYKKMKSSYTSSFFVLFLFSSTRFVQGRRYAHFLGITICIFSTSQNTSYSVEFSAVVPDPEDEFKIASSSFLSNF